MSSGRRSFRQIRYAHRCAGYPCIASINQQNLIVGDWTGHLFWIKLDPPSVHKQVRAALLLEGMLLCNDLGSLTIPRSNPAICAAATRGGYAAIWKMEKDQVQKVPSDSGPVNAVRWYSTDEILMIGTGFYALDPTKRPT